MMKFAIYGFFFDRKFTVNNFFLFEPINSNLKFLEKRKLSNAKYKYNLTGFIITSTDVEIQDFIFSMSAALSFVQQQDVIIEHIINEHPKEFFDSFYERSGAGAPFAFYPEILTEIVNKLYCKLTDFSDRCNLRTKNSPFDKAYNSEFSSLVYKSIEPFKMRKYLIEIPFYLYFSGLEAFCKRFLMSYFPEIKIETDVSRNLANMLEKFNIEYISVNSADSEYNLRSKEIPSDEFLKLSLSTYSNLRNALFHQNLFIAQTECSNKKYKENGKEKFYKTEVKITEFDFYLHRLCNAVILKYTNIENQSLDCNKWHTRLPFIKNN